MQRGKFIPSIRVASTNGTAGAISGHSLAFETVIPLHESYQFVILFPAQTRPPLKDSTCAGGASLADALSCLVTQDIVKVSGLKFRDASQSTADFLPVGSTVSFTVAGSSNPLSAKPTDSYIFYIKDAAGNLMSGASELDFQPMQLKMTVPATI